jgi:hypothetical protein
LLHRHLARRFHLLLLPVLVVILSGRSPESKDPEAFNPTQTARLFSTPASPVVAPHIRGKIVIPKNKSSKVGKISTAEK